MLSYRKRQRDPNKFAIACGSGDDQSSHGLTRGHWRLREGQAVSKY